MSGGDLADKERKGEAMLGIMQPTPSFNMPFVPAADPALKILEKQIEARHAAVKPKDSDNFIGGDDTSSAAVESSLAADAIYGLVGDVSLSSASNLYQQTSALTIHTQGVASAPAGSRIDTDI